MEKKKYLGIDWGEKRIGLAIAEEGLLIALPFKTVSNLKELMEVIQEEEIAEIVLGNPLSMRDAKLDTNEKFNNFHKLLKERTDLKINLFDERMSSKQADSFEGDKKTKASRDEISAMIILQDFLVRNIS